MTEPRSSLYRRHRYPSEIIAEAVWLYFRFPLSFRMVEDMLAYRALSQIFQQVKTGLIPGRNYAASSAKTLNGEPLSFANWFLRIMCATSMPAMVAAAE